MTDRTSWRTPRARFGDVPIDFLDHRIKFEPPPSVKTSTPMEDSIIVHVWS